LTEITGRRQSAPLVSNGECDSRTEPKRKEEAGRVSLKEDLSLVVGEVRDGRGGVLLSSNDVIRSQGALRHQDKDQRAARRLAMAEDPWESLGEDAGLGVQQKRGTRGFRQDASKDWVDGAFPFSVEGYAGPLRAIRKSPTMGRQREGPNLDVYIAPYRERKQSLSKDWKGYRGSSNAEEGAESRPSRYSLHRTGKISAPKEEGIDFKAEAS